MKKSPLHQILYGNKNKRKRKKFPTSTKNLTSIFSQVKVFLCSSPIWNASQAQIKVKIKAAYTKSANFGDETFFFR